MKKLILILSLTIAHSLSAQITLRECIENGLSNKANIKSAKSDVLLANLKIIESKGKFLPQISLTYDYRYNPIIATQVVPVGQFNPIPTDETRAIQFGTNWQQNVSITLYQPIIDFTVQSRIKESKLNESLASVDLVKAESDLTFEIVNTYSRVLTFGYQVDEAISDTLRSYQSYSIVNSKFKEGKFLKTELNNALINHNSNLSNYKKEVSLLINEKIYLHYLTSLDLERILDGKFAPIPASLLSQSKDQVEIQFESIPEFQRLGIKEQLVKQQIKTERIKYHPTIGFQGFLGANQFSQTFNPFLSNSWFGNSYVGLAVKLPIFSPEKSINGGEQLQTQLQVVNFEKEALKTEKNKALLQINLEINRLSEEIKILENSFLLQNENILLYQERMLNGQLASSELNVQEAELQKLSSQLKQLKEQFSKALIEQLYITGSLSSKIKTI
jgi:outer membrane protein